MEIEYLANRLGIIFNMSNSQELAALFHYYQQQQQKQNPLQQLNNINENKSDKGLDNVTSQIDETKDFFVNESQNVVASLQKSSKNFHFLFASLSQLQKTYMHFFLNLNIQRIQ